MPDSAPSQLLSTSSLDGELTDLEHTTFQGFSTPWEIVVVSPQTTRPPLRSLKAKAQQTVDKRSHAAISWSISIAMLDSPGQDCEARPLKKMVRNVLRRVSWVQRRGWAGSQPSFLRLVWLTKQIQQLILPDAYELIEPQMPVIWAFWHGQHFLTLVHQEETNSITRQGADLAASATANSTRFAGRTAGRRLQYAAPADHGSAFQPQGAASVRSMDDGTRAGKRSIMWR